MCACVCLCVSAEGCLQVVRVWGEAPEVGLTLKLERSELGGGGSYPGGALKGGPRPLEYTQGSLESQRQMNDDYATNVLIGLGPATLRTEMSLVVYNLAKGWGWWEILLFKGNDLKPHETRRWEVEDQEAAVEDQVATGWVTPVPRGLCSTFCCASPLPLPPGAGDLARAVGRGLGEGAHAPVLCLAPHQPSAPPAAAGAPRRGSAFLLPRAPAEMPTTPAPELHLLNPPPEPTSLPPTS